MTAEEKKEFIARHNHIFKHIGEEEIKDSLKAWVVFGFTEEERKFMNENFEITLELKNAFGLHTIEWTPNSLNLVNEFFNTSF